MDYNNEMLQLYFKEKGFSKEKIEELLESNPFNLDYIIWEKKRINMNRTTAINLKRHSFINPTNNIQEIVNTPENNISKYLYLNNSRLRVCSSRDKLTKIQFDNSLLLINGLFDNEYEFIKKVNEKNIRFILTMTTNIDRLYSEYLDMVYRIADEIDVTCIKHIQNENSTTCIVKK